MKKMKKALAWVLLVAMLAGFATGCGMSDEEFQQKGIALVVIVGRHANAHRYTDDELEKLIGDKLDQAVERTISGDDYKVSVNCSILVVDGDPEQAYATYKGEIVDLNVSAKSAEKVLHELDYIKEDIMNCLLSDDLRADDPEVDLLAAIAEGTTILNNYPDDVEKHMVIYDTGINTTGLFDMTKIDIQQGDVGQILDQLPPGAFPKMNGIHVTFGGLGNVCYGQMDMRNDSVFQGRLEELWTAFFTDEKCGAVLDSKIKYAAEGNNPQIYDDPDKDTASGETVDASALYPYVSSVPFVISEPTIIEEIISGDEIIVLDSLSLGFLGDSAEFRDRDAAMKALASYADAIEKMKQSSGITLYVVGSKAKTAPDEEVDLTEQLSADRAKAVVELLKEMYNFPDAQLKIINADITPFSWRNGVEFPDGTEESLDRDEQRKNRVVALIPSTATDYVNELVQAGLLEATN